MNEKELKPCPFCGGEAIAQQDFAGGLIMCTKCGAFMRNRTGFNIDDIIPEWNKRHYTKSVAMLPCKYCGSKKHWYTTVATGHEEMISCRGCGVEAEWGSSHVQAIRNWNALMQERVENDDSKATD